MGLISGLLGLFRRSQPIVLDDPVFGRIRYQDVGFWEGTIDFSPLRRQVEVLIDADESGPNEEQRQWLREVERDYASQLPRVVDAAWPEIHEWDESIAKEALPEILNLETISVNRCDSSSCNWELTFLCENIEHWVNIALSDWTPGNVLIDG